MRTPLAVAGTLVAVAGAALLVLGLTGLGRALTPFPRPRADGGLVETGVYGLARHPMYGGGILFGLGWSLATSPLALVPTALLVVLAELKSRREEVWLAERFPGYDAYRERTPRRFVPWLY